MPETLSIVVSIFGLVGLGYASVRIGLLPLAVGEGLSAFVFTLAIPLLLFRTLAIADFEGVSAWRIWAAYLPCFAATWCLGHLTARYLFGRDFRSGVVAGASAAYANTVLLGVPLIQAAFGEPGMVFLIVIIAVHSPVMLLASIALNEWAVAAAEGETETDARPDIMRRLAAALLTNPIFLGVILGALWRLTGFAIPGVLDAIIAPLTRSAGPLALVASGMALVKFGIARQIFPALTLSVLKLALLPALVFAAAHLMGLPPLGIAAMTLGAACPTGVNVFVIATRLGTGEALASNTVLISTAIGVATVTLWLVAMKASLL